MIWYNENSGDLDYLYIIKNSVEENANYYNFLVRFGNWILLFNNFVPICFFIIIIIIFIIKNIIHIFSLIFSSSKINF